MKQPNEIEPKRLAMRERLWGEQDPRYLLQGVGKKGSWMLMPRAMPLLLRIMDDMSYGKPVSSVYFDLCCHSHNDSYAVTNKPQEMAFSAGFGGQRAVRTWKDRIRILSDLNFIDIKEGPSGPFSYVLLWNPYLIIKMHEENKTPGLEPLAYNALLERMMEIGATDLD